MSGAFLTRNAAAVYQERYLKAYPMIQRRIGAAAEIPSKLSDQIEGWMFSQLEAFSKSESVRLKGDRNPCSSN
jgi:hypothetical protein